MVNIEWRKYVIAAVLLVVAVLSWWLPQVLTPPPPPEEVRRGRTPDYTVENFTAVTVNELGQKLYQLSAKRLVHYADEGSELDHPYLIQYREELAPTHTRANKGWIPIDRRHIVLTGEVHMARGRDPDSGGADVRSDTMSIELERPSNKRSEQPKRHALPKQ